MDDTQAIPTMSEQAPPPPPAVLSVQALGIRNPVGWAVRSLDLTVAAGTVVSVHGPVGGGHTRTLLALAGRFQPDEGQVDLPAGPAVIGWFPDMELLDNELTVSENLVESLEAIGADRSGLSAAIRLAGLQELSDLRVAALTCEQKVLLGLAWCFQSANPVVVVEATCVTSAESPVWSAARRLAQLGRAVVVGTTLPELPAEVVVELGRSPEPDPDPTDKTGPDIPEHMQPGAHAPSEEDPA